jgi:predicted PurR-regulated permease PerM
VGAAHERSFGQAVSPRARRTTHQAAGVGGAEAAIGAHELRRQMMFWLGSLLLLVLLLWLLSAILLPFVAGLAIAYLLNPLVDRLARVGVNRLAAALSIIVLAVLIFVVLILLVVPILSGQLTSFISNIPGYVTKLQTLLTDQSQPWVQKLLGAGFNPDKSISDLVSQGVGWLTTFLRSLWSGGRALISVFSLIVVTPVVAFYLLYDWHKMLRSVDNAVPVNQRETVRRLARECDAAIAGFVRGQSAVCVILGTFYAVALTLAGLNFGLLIGLLAGLITFIPYVGSLTGLILGLGVAVAQFWPHWGPVLIVLAIFVVGQFSEGNILSPKLVGERVGLHPVWVMFALLAFGYLFGFVGLLVAVPLAATIGVLARFGLGRYRESSLYTGASTE